MLVDFRRPSSWSDLTERAANQLDVVLLKNQLRFYQNTSHALLEITQGLARQAPTKKKIFYFKNMSVAFDPALTYLAKEGYQLTALDWAQLEQPETLMSSFDRETLCVLYSVDEPLLGLTFSVTHLEEALKKAGTPRVRLSHFRDQYQPFVSVAERTEVRIGGMASGGAYALMGERLRTNSPVAEVLEWQDFPLSEVELQILKRGVSLSNSVKGELKSLEEHPGLGMKPLAFTHGTRFYDRALLCWGDLDGHAVVDRWSKKLGFELRPPGQETRLETTSLSRWGGVKTFDFLQPFGLTAQDRRGLVIVGAELVQKFGASELQKTLVEVRRSLIQEQNGG